MFEEMGDTIYLRSLITTANPHHHGSCNRIDAFHGNEHEPDAVFEGYFIVGFTLSPAEGNFCHASYRTKVPFI